MFHNADLIIYGIVNNFISKFDLEDYRIFLFVVFCIIFNTIPRFYKNKVFKLIKHSIIKKPNYLYFEYHEGRREYYSDNFKGLMLYINRNCYARETKEVISPDDNHFFQVAQDDFFIVNAELEIYGNIVINEREIKSHSETKFAISTYLTLYSYKTTNKTMVEWIEKLGQQYRNNINNDFKKTQKVIEIYYNDCGMNKGYPIISKINFESNTNFENTCFPYEEEIIAKVKFFCENKDYFGEKGIRRALNFLFSGEPGTGKSAIIKALAKMTGRHLVMIKLDEKYPIRTLEENLNGIFSSTLKFDLEEIIIVIEEIDLVCQYFQDRDVYKNDEEESKKKNTIEKKKSALGILLNSLDGIPECNGRMIIMTTNKPEKLDPALKRPGRTEHYHFKKFSKHEIFKACKKFWKEDFLWSEEDICENKDNFFTAAELMCLNINSNGNIDKIKEVLIK